MKLLSGAKKGYRARLPATQDWCALALITRRRAVRQASCWLSSRETRDEGGAAGVQTSAELPFSSALQVTLVRRREGHTSMSSKTGPRKNTRAVAMEATCRPESGRTLERPCAPLLAACTGRELRRRRCGTATWMARYSRVSAQRGKSWQRSGPDRSLQGARKGRPIGVKLTERDFGVAARFIARGGRYPRRGRAPPQRHKCRNYALNLTPMGDRKGRPYISPHQFKIDRALAYVGRKRRAVFVGS